MEPICYSYDSSEDDFSVQENWWKDGISYAEAVDRGRENSNLSSLEHEFNELADRWQWETALQSSPTKRFMHEGYQTIMAMGPCVIPFILRRMEKQPGHWFWALKHLVRKDVAKGQETFSGAVSAWLKWGKLSGHI